MGSRLSNPKDIRFKLEVKRAVTDERGQAVALKLTRNQQEIVKICQFLEVDFEPDMLDENNWTEQQGNKWKSDLGC